MKENFVEIEKILSYIGRQDRDIWARIGEALKTELGENGFYLFDKWSQQFFDYDEKDIRSSWQSFKIEANNIGVLYRC